MWMAIKFKRFIYIGEIGNGQIYSIISYDMKRFVSIHFFFPNEINLSDIREKIIL